MRVLVTGATGFLGKHVMQELKNRNHQAVIFRNDAGGLLNNKQIDLTLSCNSYDAIVHLAAKCGGIGANMESPGSFFYENLMMGANIIEAARRYYIDKIVVVGTVCSYPKYTPVPFKEEDLWNGFPEETNAPYGIAKKALLTMLQAYRQQYGMNGIYLIPVNLYGPHDSFDLQKSHVIPAMIKKFHQAKEQGLSTIEMWGSGKASREFLYVEDAARGIVDGLEKYDSPDPVNLGVGKEYTILKLANIIKVLVGFEGSLSWDLSKPDGQPRRCLDVSKAKDLFGFTAKMDFEEGLQKTYDWWLNTEENNS